MPKQRSKSDRRAVIALAPQKPEAFHASVLPYNQVVETPITGMDKQYVYGTKKQWVDLTPQEILHKVAASGTATQCMEKLAKFTQADGFVSKDANALPVNPQQTAADLLAESAPVLKHFGGIAWNVKYALDGTVGEVYCMPFELFRKREDGMLVYNKNRGKKEYNKKDDIVYPPFDPEKVDIEADLAANGGKQKGQIFYAFTPKPGQTVYPVPGFYAAIDDIETDGEISAFDNEQIKNGFFPSAILTVLGKVDDQTKDEQGLTKIARLRETLKKFTAKGEGRGKLLLLTAENKDMVPDLQAFQIDKVLAGMGEFSDRIARKVVRAFGVPPVLVGFADTATLGNTQAIANSLQLFNADITDGQRFLSRCFAKIWPDIDWTLTQLNLMDYVPDSVLDRLSDSEIRKIFNLTESPVKLSKASQNLLDGLFALPQDVRATVLPTLGDDDKRGIVGLQPLDDENVKELLNGNQVSSLIQIAQAVKQQQILPESAIEIIKLSYGVSRARAAKLIGQTNAPNQTPNSGIPAADA